MGSRAASVALLIVLVSACGSSADDSVSSSPATAPTTESSATTPSQVGGIGDAVDVAAGAPAEADSAACGIDRQTLETAADIYLTLNGTPPSSQTALVQAQLIGEASPRFEIDADGAVVPAPGSPC